MEEIEIDIHPPLKECLTYCLDCDPMCCGLDAFYTSSEVVSTWVRQATLTQRAEARQQLAELFAAVEDPSKGVHCSFLNAHSCNAEGKKYFLRFLREFSDSLAIDPAGLATVRLAVPDDAYRISQILSSAFGEFHSQYTSLAYQATTPTANEIIERFSLGPIWLAMIDTSRVGTVWGTIEDRSFHIRSMAVLPAARGHRLGLQLLKTAQEFALAHNCNRMHLSTTPFLAGAIHLYERFGFVNCGTSSLHGTPLLLMEKRLDVSPSPA